MASLTSGYAYPRVTGPNPFLKSINSRPSMSHTRQPLPRTIAAGSYGGYDGAFEQVDEPHGISLWALSRYSLRLKSDMIYFSLCIGYYFLLTRHLNNYPVKREKALEYGLFSLVRQDLFKCRFNNNCFKKCSSRDQRVTFLIHFLLLKRKNPIIILTISSEKKAEYTIYTGKRNT
ncbi:hypothetical protein SDC9_86932 [bioreactor metagenome]|uniref:Uncharacterized protein n=1 Tax=bioreactor metagenome TaxID=1076179 RepID=A0A644ZHB6_9ZZZZ